MPPKDATPPMLHRQPAPPAAAAWLLLAVLMPAAAVADLLSLEPYGIDQGLSQNSVTALAEDAAGFLWIGTQEGLNRFDGHRFTVFLHQPRDAASLPSSSIDALAIAPDGRLWIGSNDAGLLRWPLGGSTREHIGPGAGLAHRTVQALALDGAGGAWSASPAGIDHVDADGRVRRLLEAADLVDVVADGERGALTLDHGCRLWRLAKDRAGAPQQALDPARRCHALALDDGAIWIGADDGAVYRLPHRGGNVLRYAASAGSDAGAAVTALLRRQDGRLWIGLANGGLAELDPRIAGSLRPLALDRRIDGAIDLLFESRSQVVWIGAQTRGLFRVRPLSAAIRRDHPTLAGQAGWPSRSLRAIWRAGELTLLGTDAGLLQKDGGGGAWRRLDAIPAVSVRVILERPGGGWWVGTHAGLWVLEADGSARELAGLPNPRVSALLLAPEGLWVATRGGLTLWREDGFAPDAVPTPLREAFLTSLLREPDGTLWIGSNELGLFRLGADGALEHLGTHDGRLGHDSVWALHGSKDAIWAGTFSGGLQRIDRRGGPLRVFDQRSGLSNNVVYRIEEDARGRLWLSTNQGLNVLDPAQQTVQTLQRADGLRNREFNSGASLRDADGLLYFGGIDGLDVIEPDALQSISEAATPAIAGLRLIGRRSGDEARPDAAIDASAIAYRERIALGPGERVMALDLVAIDFSAPDSAGLRYRLAGPDADWIRAQGARAELLLSYLPPGQHLLQIEAAGRDGRFLSSRNLHIDVLPPPWRHPLAYAAYAAAGGGLLLWLLALVRARSRAKLARIAQLDRLVARRTEELEQANRRLQESNARLELATRTDPLTRIANRRSLQDWLAESGAHARRSGERHGLLFCMIDIDDFKPINDRHGHAVGDAVLVAVAERLRRICREQDLLVRWGGEEFLLALREPDTGRVAGIGDRILRAVAGQPFEVGESGSLRITCSAGLAPWPLLPDHIDEESWQRAIALADRALYAAKARGKNAWVAHLPAPGADPAPLGEWLREMPAGEPPAKLIQRIESQRE
jgi:diguanylate cyclase (GGDEF)-like protein